MEFIFLVIAVLVNIGLIYIVLRNSVYSATNIIFIALSVLMSAWLIIIYLSINPSSKILALIYVRLSIFIATPMIMSFYLFSYVIPENRLKFSRKKLTSLLIITAVTMVISYSPYTFIKAERDGNTFKAISGPGMLVFGCYSTYFSILAVIQLLKKLKSFEGIKKQQIKFILYGIVLMFGSIITTVFIPVVLLQKSAYLQFIPLYSILFLILTTYAIIKHHLFNIKIVVTELAIGILSFIFFIRVLLSTSLFDLFLNFIVLASIFFIGIILVRSVIKEIQRREEIQKLAQELKKANKQLLKLDEAKTEFLSIASHQLRTPLSAMKGYLSMLSDGDYGKVPKEQAEVIDTLVRNTERLIRLVNIFLNISRIESGRLKILKNKRDLGKVIDEVIKYLLIDAQKKGIKIVYDNKNLPEFMFDDDKLHDVIVNLIDNAIKYTESGGVIEISTRLLESYIVVIIKDNGRGIEYGELDNLFEKFRRGHGINKVDPSGSGLGLFIARKIVEGHGGNIWAESDGIGKGATFKFTLPLE